MDREKLKKGAWAVGGAAVLAGAVAACVKGMRAVDKRLQEKRDAEAMKAAEEELFGAFEEEEEASLAEKPAE